MIIRAKGVKVEALENIYKTLRQVIKDDSCFYTKDEVKELKENRDFILLNGGSING